MGSHRLFRLAFCTARATKGKNRYMPKIIGAYHMCPSCTWDVVNRAVTSLRHSNPVWFIQPRKKVYSTTQQPMHTASRSRWVR